MVAPSADTVRALQQYTACDISDALLKLKVPGAGFLADLNLYSQPEAGLGPRTIAPASTVLFVPKGETPEQLASNIPTGKHWADLTPPGSFVILKQPDGQHNAVCGGIMAWRMMILGAKGVVVVGRARDIAELKSTGLPVSSWLLRP
jgi:regulator of RNase E activity RraA